MYKYWWDIIGSNDPLLQGEHGEELHRGDILLEWAAAAIRISIHWDTF